MSTLAENIRLGTGITMAERQRTAAAQSEQEAEDRKKWDAVFAEFPAGSFWTRRDDRTLLAYYLETVYAPDRTARAFAYGPGHFPEVIVIPLAHLKDIGFEQVSRNEFFERVCMMLEDAKKNAMGEAYDPNHPLFATLHWELP